MARLEDLTTFCEVVDQKSFSRAADLLGLTQPAVSMQIKSLEAEYGTELLHRGGFEIVPTESGRVVYEFARQTVDLHAKSKQMVRELQGEVGGVLSVGASTGPGEYLLPLLLGRFKDLHPQLEISLRVGDSDVVIEQVLKQQTELGFVGMSRRDRHLSFVPFIRDQLVLVVHPSHAWAGRAAISLEDLLQAPLILQQTGSGATTSLYEALAEYDVAAGDLNVIMELGLQESTKAAVGAGFGVTFISRIGALEDLSKGVLIEVPVEGIELNRDFHVVYLRTAPLTRLAGSFLEFARPAAEDVVEGLQDGLLI